MCVVKETGASFIQHGTLTVYSDARNKAKAVINLKKGATLEIDGDFGIINGCYIRVEENGFLKIGGKQSESSCHMISSSIEVLKRVEIGHDCLLGEGTFITDCDWHSHFCEGAPCVAQSAVLVGIHVWFCARSCVLKGSIVGDGCVVGCMSLLAGGQYPARSLLVGVPAKVSKTNYCWSFALS
jgi:acetyltransferase-like isoleucine patch superfamily enzyme